MRPWFGLHLPSYTFSNTPPERLFDRVVEQAQTAEAAGFSLVTVMDHLYQIGGVGAEIEPMLEGWSVLNALARETSRVRLATLVTGVTYRNPALLAKMATTLDVTSGGRMILGLGAAWNDVEHAGYGYEFPPVGERMDRLDEALTIIRAMFTEDRPSFTGRFYRIDRALNVPKPVQPAGPKIMVGGGGEQRTLRIAARHADITHWFPLGLDVLRRKTEVLARYCEEIDRDPAEIERTMATPVIVAATSAEFEAFRDRLPAERRPHVVGGTPEQAADGLRPYLDAGFTGFTFNNTTYRTPEQIGAIGELLRLVGGTVPARA
ncbi:MAG TPA: LLM class F420-dependent oxidoreductase [Candidatus Limnocylindrales bacterium]|nr:LLM class F420-dependent oxidoreductase [Candidatus Limnocylindrales bacterium]